MHRELFLSSCAWRGCWPPSSSPEGIGGGISNRCSWREPWFLLEVIVTWQDLTHLQVTVAGFPGSAAGCRAMALHLQPLKSLLPRGTASFTPAWSLPCQSICLCWVNADLFAPCQAKQVGSQGVKRSCWPTAESACSPLRMLFTKQPRQEGEWMQWHLYVCCYLHLLLEAMGRPQE